MASNLCTIWHTHHVHNRYGYPSGIEVFTLGMSMCKNLYPLTTRIGYGIVLDCTYHTISILISGHLPMWMFWSAMRHRAVRAQFFLAQYFQQDRNQARAGNARSLCLARPSPRQCGSTSSFSGAAPLDARLLGCWPALPGRLLPSSARPSAGAALDLGCWCGRAMLEWCGTLES